MDKTIKIIYWVSTGLLTALMTFSAGMYFFNYEEVVKVFTSLGHPAHMVYPLAVAKILGLITLWVKGFPALKEWAYAGFFFNTVLAFVAHIVANDGSMGGAGFAIVLVLTSYFTYKKRLASAAA